MKVKFKILPTVLLAMTFLSSCSLFSGGGGGRSGNVSPTTGWNYNDPDLGGFEVISGYEQETGPGLVFIEGGTFTMGRTEQDILYDWNNIPKRVTVSSFYMDETEVANVDYREYLYWLSRVYVSFPEVYKNALPDTLVWRDPLAYNEPYVEYYFRHPSYNDYPVVGVTWLQANDFCSWRTDRVNELSIINEGILNPDPNQQDENNFNTEAYLAGQYEGLVNQNLPSLDPNKEERRVKMEDGLLLPRYRLPSEAEWEFAALALKGNTYEERIYERRMYPWDGHNVRNADNRNRGKFMANFTRGKGDLMGVAGNLNDNASITAPVMSFWPNDYNLYCMAGNVNEWVYDVYRSLSPQDVSAFNPLRGNVFQTRVTDPDGNLATKDSLGRIRYRNVTAEESAGRYNYQKADYRDYKDGDYQSMIVPGSSWQDESSADKSVVMYSQLKEDYNSLVSNEARVYKGGSWRDRAYWLCPGARRYMYQGSARNDLGFRCAMTRVGSPGGF
ncbi:MAG: SUMF1/EgtB/PvdO family nonheme iron enzyme [Bacteroidetes bacterium]|nr:SUMF1/EgtB/PvdO family nonheme iron enzyme [Bacteroidota bacterium]